MMSMRKLESVGVNSFMRECNVFLVWTHKSPEGVPKGTKSGNGAYYYSATPIRQPLSGI